MQRLVSLAVFLLLVVVAAAVGGQYVGGDWYLVMIKPSWNPTPMVMASVWGVLYVLMAVSAWMVWDTMRGLARVALGWWGLQLLLSIVWSWLFFGLNRIGWSMAVVSLWILVVLIVIRMFRPIKPEASNLMMPLAGWLVYIWALNFSQWHLNGGGLGSIF
ncbi:MAG: TspO/MBR family protein [Xanthomonadales bacterium]|nr:TspO/MBR family protein [Xanthomonadales bacterium]